MTLLPLGQYEQANVLGALGETQRAASRYRQFLDNYDRAPQEHAPYVERARKWLSDEKGRSTTRTAPK